MARVNRSIASPLVGVGFASGSGVFSGSTGSGLVGATIGIGGGGDSGGGGGSSAGGGGGRPPPPGPGSAASVIVGRDRWASGRLSPLGAGSRGYAASPSVSAFEAHPRWGSEGC